MNNKTNSKPDQSEGEINTSERRKQWTASTQNEQANRLLADDTHYFLHQSVSTPCVSTIAKAEGAYIEDIQGNRYLDFHGNNVHHIGYGHPRLKQAISEQMDTLPFAPRRFACQPAVDLAKNSAKSLLEIYPKCCLPLAVLMLLKLH